jgi:hypothetical protein
MNSNNSTIKHIGNLSSDQSSLLLASDLATLTSDLNAEVSRATAVEATKLPLTGGTVSGALTIAGSYGNMVSYSGFRGARQLRLLNPLNAVASWAIGGQTDGTPTTSDNELYLEVTYSNGIAHIAGYVQDGVSNIQMNFTGQHRCYPEFTFDKSMVGLIVESTGRHMNLLSIGQECHCINITDAIPVVQLCESTLSKRVLGVIAGEEKARTFGGNFCEVYPKEPGDKRLFVNSLGEGGLWVSNVNGTIDNGDYICPAGAGGYGMRQDDDLLHSYTVAKSTTFCDFNPPIEPVKIYSGYDEESNTIIWETKTDPDTGEPILQPIYEVKTLDDGTKVAFIGVTYHCG